MFKLQVWQWVAHLNELYLILKVSAGKVSVPGVIRTFAFLSRDVGSTQKVEHIHIQGLKGATF